MNHAQLTKAIEANLLEGITITGSHEATDITDAGFEFSNGGIIQVTQNPLHPYWVQRWSDDEESLEGIKHAAFAKDAAAAINELGA